jgi:hypothetical protein
MTTSALLLAALAAAPATFRLDYFHTGDAKEERFSLDRVVVEPLPWPGNPATPLDEINLGRYLFEVRDRDTNRLLYSRGFASIYGEWETTSEASRVRRTFSESLRFPAPARPVQIVLKKRDRENRFVEVWTASVDPDDQTVDRSRPPSPGPLIEIQKSGDPARKVDLLIMGDGYTAAERGKFEKDARKLAETLFAYSPFKERRSDFNVWGLCPAAQESGVSRPSTGIHRRSPVGASYDAFGSERYVLTFENRAFRDLASFAPYDVVEILVNAQTYGGGGIFNLYSTVAADSLWAPYLFIHEFGHHFAGLADEYYTSDVPTEPTGERSEPWEKNVTALLDPARLKWKVQAAKGVAVPTPWPKDPFEKHAREIHARRRKIRADNRPEGEMDALFLEQMKDESALLQADPAFGKVGAFEGANYEAKGYFRPQMDCVMFSRNKVPFCSVCQGAIEQVIDLYAGPKAR